MSKFDLLNEVLTLKQTEEYLEEVFDDLESIYELDEPPTGRKGTIWRTIWSRPNRCTPMSYYLSLKLINEIENNAETLKEARKIAREKERNKLSDLKSKLEKGGEEIANTKETLGLEIERVENENSKLSKELSLTRRKKYNLEEEFEAYRKRVDTGKNISNEHYIKDINMLVKRLRKYVHVDLDDLASIRAGKHGKE